MKILGGILIFAGVGIAYAMDWNWIGDIIMFVLIIGGIVSSKSGD